MRPVRFVMVLAVLVAALFSVVTWSGQSNPANAAQATGAATVAPTTADGAVTATGSAGGSTAPATTAATVAATTAATTGGAAPVAATATLTRTATRQPAGRATVGPRPVVFGPCPNPNMAGAAGAVTATVARTPAAATAIAPIDMGSGVTVAIDSRSTALAQGGQFEIVTQILDLQPGAVTVPHVHTGPATVVVIIGEVTNCTATTQQVFSTGQSWTERPNAVGAIANTGSVAARIAMIMIAPRNRPPMVVVPVITVTPGTR